MCNKDALVSYLYDDLAGPERAAFERHLSTCDECREEMAAMRSVRADLLTWSPPEPDFAFRIVNNAEARDTRGTVLRPNVPSWRAWFTPAAGFAAAAVLVLAAAAGLARIEVHNGPDGWTLRTGSATSGETASAGLAPMRGRDINLTTGADAAEWASIERRISALETATRDTNVRNASVQSARVSNDEVLKVVRELLAQSETRQKGELALRLQQVIRDMDLKRAADLNGVRQGISRIDASVAASATDDAAMHKELFSYFLANSKQK